MGDNVSSCMRRVKFEGQSRRLIICNTLVWLGRVYAAYDRIFIVLSLSWGWVMDGIKLDRFDIMASAILPVCPSVGLTGCGKNCFEPYGIGDWSIWNDRESLLQGLKEIVQQDRSKLRGESYFVPYVGLTRGKSKAGGLFFKHPVRNTKVGRSLRPLPPFVLADLSIRNLV